METKTTKTLKIKELRALKKYIICQEIPEEFITPAGLVIPEQQREGIPLKARVLTAPKDVDLQKGDIVWHSGRCIEFMLTPDSGKFLAIEDYQIVCFIRPTEDTEEKPLVEAVKSIVM